jgi:hypothetical protein
VRRPAPAEAPEDGEVEAAGPAVEFLVEPNSTATAKCFASGSGGRYFEVCISDHGNILSIRNGAEKRLLLFEGEGYAVCSGSGLVHGWDNSFFEGPWGPTTVSYPTTSTVLVTRTTADGKLKLEMKFSRNTADFETTVQTTGTNVSNATISGVELARFGYALGPAVRTAMAVTYAVQGSGFFGFSLRAVTAGTTGIGHTSLTNYSSYEQLNSCRPVAVQPVPPAIYTALLGETYYRSIYSLGNLAAGQKKTVKHVYAVT